MEGIPSLLSDKSVGVARAGVEAGGGEVGSATAGAVSGAAASGCGVKASSEAKKAVTTGAEHGVATPVDGGPAKLEPKSSPNPAAKLELKSGPRGGLPWSRIPVRSNVPPEADPRRLKASIVAACDVSTTGRGTGKGEKAASPKPVLCAVV
eukprot:scaffold161792_cov26-Tisochrysis_lutea.AAC.1